MVYSVVLGLVFFEREHFNCVMCTLQKYSTERERKRVVSGQLKSKPAQAVLIVNQCTRMLSKCCWCMCVCVRMCSQPEVFITCVKGSVYMVGEFLFLAYMKYSGIFAQQTTNVRISGL